MIKFNERRSKYEVFTSEGLVFSFSKLEDAVSFVASLKER